MSLVDAELTEKYGDVPPEFTVTKQDLLTIMHKYTKLIAEKKSLEKMIPRTFTQEQELCTNLEYSKSDKDLQTFTKVFT